MSAGDRRVIYSRAWRSGGFDELVDAARLAVDSGDEHTDRKARLIVAEVTGELARGSALDVAGVAALLPHVLRGALPVDDLFDVDALHETTGDPSIGDAGLDRDLSAAGFPRLAEHHGEAWELARQLARDSQLAELALRGWVTSFDTEGFYDGADYERAITALLRAGSSDATVDVELTDDQIRVVVHHAKGEAIVTAEYDGAKWADVDVIKKAAGKAFGRARKIYVFGNGQGVVLATVPAAATRYVTTQ
jgi:hypothetical protein